MDKMNISKKLSRNVLKLNSHFKKVWEVGKITWLMFLFLLIMKFVSFKQFFLYEWKFLFFVSKSINIIEMVEIS